MSQQATSEASQRITNLTPIDINGQTVYLAQIQSEPAGYLQTGRTSLSNVFSVAGPISMGSGMVSSGSNILSSGSNILSPGSNILSPGSNILSSGSNILSPGTIGVSPGASVLTSGASRPIPSPGTYTGGSTLRTSGLVPSMLSPNLITVPASLTSLANLPPSLTKPYDSTSSYKQYQHGHKVSNGEGTRKLLLPWLVEHLDKRSFSGARWSDRRSGLFLLPWKHGRNRGFDEEEHGEIFKEWAINTGRYLRHERPAHKTWKATLRNALHKHPHISECKEYGKSGEYRAYQIIVPLEGIEEAQATKSGFKRLSDDSLCELMGPPPPLTPKTPTTFVNVMSPSVPTPTSVMSGPTTPATPTNSNPDKDYRSTDAHSLFSPVSALSSPHSNESEYPTDLEMSPNSSVVTTVDVVNPAGESSKQHIRSASGTVLTDFEEILKDIQVSIPDKNEEDPSGYNMDLDEMLIGNKFLMEPMNTNQYQPDQDIVQYIPHNDKMPEQTTIQQQFLMQERRKQIDFQMQKQKEQQQQFQQRQQQQKEQQQQFQQQQQQQKEQQEQFQQRQQQQREQQQQFEQQQKDLQLQQQQFQKQQKELQLQQQKYFQHHKRVELQVGKQQQIQQQNNSQQQQKHQQNNLQHQQKHQQANLQQQPTNLQELHKQIDVQPQSQPATSRSPASPTVPTLNAEQHLKLVELKKQRDTLKTQAVPGASDDNKPLTVDEFPMEELLGSGTVPETRRLGKRPRLETTSDIQLEGLNGTVDYIAKLKQIGLPKKQSPNSMAITIYYKTVGVAAYGISNPVGARLFFCSNQRVQFSDEKVTHELYGPKDATQICMPWCRDNTPTQTLLGTLTRGVILQEEDEDIFATRLCQCAVFFGDKRGVLTKLERGQRVKIFDFKSRFLPLYFQHLQSQSGKGSNDIVLDPFPEQDVMLSFGQRWDDRRPIANTLIWAKVIHMKARQLTLDFTQLFPPPPPIANEDCIQFSESDPYDRLADAFSLAL